MNYSFVSEGKPAVKQRPRLGRRGRVFTPQATHDAEQLMADQYNGPLFEGPVHVEMRFSKDHTGVYIEDLDYEPIKALRGDNDNMIKLVCDALIGKAWSDDRQVKSIYAYFDGAE